MVIKFKQFPRMQPGDSHPHEKTMELSDTWIKYDKGHYVTRPYQKYVTSKWEQSMLDVYEILFDHIKHDPITMLEIGVYSGESMRYFSEYFTHPDSKIIGADHNGPTFHGGFPVEGYTLELGDQTDLSFLQTLSGHGPFDVIIDDASHDPDVTNLTFKHLWPHVKQEGFYIIEDVLYDIMHHILNEVVTSKQGKGFISRDSRGFGTPETVGSGTLTILKKTKNLMVGIEEELTDE